MQDMQMMNILNENYSKQQTIRVNESTKDKEKSTSLVSRSTKDIETEEN